MLSRRDWLLAGCILLLLAGAGMLDPRFVSVRSQTLLFSHLWEMAIVAVPMLLLIVIGGIDLSVGSIMALSGVLFGLLIEKGLPFPVCVALCIAMGTFLGAFNGWFVAVLRIPPLLVTLATMAAFRGVAEGLSNGRSLSGFPDSLLAMSNWPTPFVIFAILIALAHVLLTQTRWGRWCLAVGTEETVSRYSRIPVDRLKWSLFAFCGFVCAIAALLLIARNNSAKADLATGMELDAITAVVLGGTSIQGGKGSYWGLLFGLILVHEVREFVSWHWRMAELNLIVVGAVLILTVLLDHFLSQRDGRPVRAK